MMRPSKMHTTPGNEPSCTDSDHDASVIPIDARRSAEIAFSRVTPRISMHSATSAGPAMRYSNWLCMMRVVPSLLAYIRQHRLVFAPWCAALLPALTGHEAHFVEGKEFNSRQTQRVEGLRVIWGATPHAAVACNFNPSALTTLSMVPRLGLESPDSAL